MASLVKRELATVGIDTDKFKAHVVRASSMKLAIGVRTASGGRPSWGTETETENSSFIITFRISSEITMSLGVGL